MSQSDFNKIVPNHLPTLTHHPWPTNEDFGNCFNGHWLMLR